MNLAVCGLLLLVGLLRVESTEKILFCPEMCHCSLLGVHINVDCSGQALTELPDFGDLEIATLDLSDNEFTEIPAGLIEFPELEALILSGNRISHLSGSSLSNLNNLKTLILARNNISNWVDINPNTLLQPSPLLMLSLAQNPLTTFSGVDDSTVLISKTLKTLDLSDCKIVRMAGQMLSGLPKLEHLNMAQNPLRNIVGITSDSLTTLNLINCRLGSLPIDVFANLPALIHLNLGRNNRLSLMAKDGSQVTSESLKRIDLSYCNMGTIEIGGFPQLTTAVLRGNMIRQLPKDAFGKNQNLENLDLSLNAIGYVHPQTFRELSNLKHLDLSINMIPRIERDTFKNNNLLSTINLSRNYIGRFNRIQASSLRSLNMSWCEIVTIDPDALAGCPTITELDLSNNLISSISDNLNSESLQTLDLSMCRISSIRNTTFLGYPELSRINLSGNRFTTPFRVDFFSGLPYLQELGLSDNPWRCECKSTDFYNFFNFLVEPPSKIWDKNHLRCTSPDELYNIPWDVACFHIWYPNGSSLGTAEKIWTIIMVSVIVFSASICVVMSIKRCIEGRKITAREREREEFLEHHRDIIRQNRMAMEQEAQLNAPDPRETRPPCYEDAILMPRLDGSFASLNELNMRREKRRKLVDKDENSDETDAVITRRNRCRSEEVLSMRESRVEDGQTRRSRRTRHLDPPESIEVARTSLIERSQHPAPTFAAPPVPTPPRGSIVRPQDTELHYHSTEIVNLHLTTVEIAPRTPEDEPTSPAMAEIEKVTMRSNQDDPSPYAKRKLKYMSSFKPDEDEGSSSQSSGEKIHVVDDYFAPAEKARSSDEESFSVFSPKEIEETQKLQKDDKIRDSGGLQKPKRPTESDL
ncbi:uncharacterized protein DMENIID0001_125240 [Sergentomyia squamirostris]